MEIESNAAHERELTQEEMDSQLNPDAKEFVPTSPQRTTPTSSPFSNGTQNGNLLHRPDLLIDDDCLLAQSPRKGAANTMDNITLPSEDDFEDEISKRPKEFEDDIILRSEAAPVSSAITPAELVNGDRPGSSSSQYSYQEMNLKEAMHGDEKQEYAPEDTVETPDVAVNLISDGIATGANELAAETPVETPDDSMAKYLREQDPMSMSFYNDGTVDSKNPFAVDLNAVQVLPVDDEDDEEEEQDEIQPIERKEFNMLVEDPYYLEGQEGQQFVIQDTEFGMNNDTATPVNGGGTTADLDDLLQSFDRKEAVAPNQPDLIASGEQSAPQTNEERKSSIVQAVQEMAFEVTSLLNEVTLADREPTTTDTFDEEPPTAVVSPQFEAEHFVENIKVDEDKYAENGLSPVVNVFSLNENFNQIPATHEETEVETPIEADIQQNHSFVDYNKTNYQQQQLECDLTQAPVIEPVFNEFESNVVSTEPSGIKNVTVNFETVPTEKIIEDNQDENIAAAIGIAAALTAASAVAAVSLLSSNDVSSPTDNAPKDFIAPIVDVSSPIEESILNEVSTPIEATAPIDTSTPIDTASTDVTALTESPIKGAKVAAAPPAAKKTSAPMTAASKAKKPEVKPKSSPVSSTVKKTTSITSTAAAPLKAKPTTATAARTSTTTTAAARPRSVPSATTTAAKAPIERKPIAAKKPLTNGEVKSTSSLLSSSATAAKKTTTTLAKAASTTTTTTTKPPAITRNPVPRTTLAPKQAAPKTATSTTTTTTASKPAITARFVFYQVLRRFAIFKLIFFKIISGPQYHDQLHQYHQNHVQQAQLLQPLLDQQQPHVQLYRQRNPLQLIKRLKTQRIN